MPCISQQFALLTSSSSHLRPFLGSTISLASSSIWLRTPWHDRILAKGQTASRLRTLGRTLSNTNCAELPIDHLQGAAFVTRRAVCFHKSIGKVGTAREKRNGTRFYPFGQTEVCRYSDLILGGLCHVVLLYSFCVVLVIH